MMDPRAGFGQTPTAMQNLTSFASTVSIKTIVILIIKTSFFITVKAVLVLPVTKDFK
jgi:hypothetical protein